MKLILTKLNDVRDSWHSGFEELFGSWLWFNGIHIGKERRDFELKYNDAYHFYDLFLFYIFGSKEPLRHVYDCLAFFEKEGYKTWGPDETWRWRDEYKVPEKYRENLEKSVNGFYYIPGKRIWIYPK